MQIYRQEVLDVHFKGSIDELDGLIGDFKKRIYQSQDLSYLNHQRLENLIMGVRFKVMRRLEAFPDTIK